MRFDIYQKAELWLYLSGIFVLMTITTFLFWAMPEQDLEKLFPPISNIGIDLWILFAISFVIMIFSIFRFKSLKDKIRKLKN